MIPSGDGTCIHCVGNDIAPFVAALLCMFAFIVVLYIVIASENRAKQPHTMLLLAVASGMLITMVQQMGVFSTMSIPWVDPIKMVLDAARIFLFDIELLRIGCLVSLSPLGRFTTKLAVILITLACASGRTGVGLI